MPLAFAAEKGILPDRTIKALADAGGILPAYPFVPDQIQPASLDLRIGDVAYRVRASFLPGPRITVAKRIDQLKLHEFSLEHGAVLETGCVYIVPVIESLALPDDIAASANPKSSTGRLDVFTRVIADETRGFDRIAAGYHGPLYAEISPRTFPVLVSEGSRLSQIRFRRGQAMLDAEALRALHARERLVDSADAEVSEGISVSVDLSGLGPNGLVGYRAKRHTGLIDVVDADRIDIDHAGKAAGAIADHSRGRNGREADAQVQSLADRRLALDQTHIGMNLAQRPVTHAARLFAGVELLPDAAAEADLIEAGAIAHLDSKGPRANLGEERPRIAFLDAVETVLTVGDQPGEHVEPPGRAFRIGETGDGRAELELLDERHEIDAARLQHRPLGQIDLVKFQLGEFVANRGVGAGQEARPDAVSDLAQSQIEARGLDLIGLDLGRARDLAACDHGADCLARQDAGPGKRASWGIARRIGGAAFGQRLEKSVGRVCL